MTSCHTQPEDRMCAYGALILCDGHVCLTGPSRGRHCPCVAEELAERELAAREEALPASALDELVLLPPD